MKPETKLRRALKAQRLCDRCGHQRKSHTAGVCKRKKPRSQQKDGTYLNCECTGFLERPNNV